MQVSTFIGLASLVLCTWLGVAFFREVPVQSYPSIPITATGGPAQPELPPVALSDASPARKP